MATPARNFGFLHNVSDESDQGAGIGARRPTDELSQSQKDQQDQLNQQKLNTLIERYNGSGGKYALTQNDRQFIEGMGFNVDGDHIAPKGFWEVNWPVFAAAGSVIAAGVLAGAYGPIAAGGAGGGAESGAAAGSVLPEASTVGNIGALPSVTASGALTGAGATGAEAGLLPAAATVGNVGTLPAVTSSGALSGAGAAATTAGSAATYADLLKLIRAGGQGLGAAGQASADNQRANADLQARLANGEQNAFISDAELEQQQRESALRDAFRASYIDSGARSPFDPTPPTPTAAYKAIVDNLGGQAGTTLGKPRKYSTDTIPDPTQIYPDPRTATASTGFQNFSNIAGPIATIAGSVPPSAYAHLWDLISNYF